MRRRQLHKVRSISIAIIVLITYAILALWYIGFVNDNVKKEFFTYLSEVTKQGANVVETQIKGDFATLKSLATFTETQQELNQDFNANYFSPILTKEVAKNSFKRMGIIDTNGVATLTDGGVYDFSDRDYFQRALKGETVVSNTIIDKVDNQKINVYATPIKQEGKVISVLFSTHTADFYKELLEVSFFEGKGYSYVVQRDGTAVVLSNHPRSVSFQNIFEELKVAAKITPHEIEKVKEDFERGKSGYVSYSFAGIPKYMSYEPILINDWYMVSIVPADIANEKSVNLITSTLVATVITILFLAISLFSGLINQLKNKKELERLAFTDVVTGHPNWNQFEYDYQRLLDKNKDVKYAMISMDINQFKLINDFYGNEKGDLVLKNIGDIIQAEVREEELFCRVTGDHFILLIRFTDQEDAVDRIKQIEQNVSRWTNLLNITMSFGICIMEGMGIPPSQYSDWANLARKEIKERHDLHYAFYNESLRQKIVDEKEIENTMERALLKGQFQIYLQPKYALQNEEPVGAEALVRWVHPQKGLIMPDAFIPLFERNGFVKKVDIYVLRQVCKQIKAWESVIPTNSKFSISVNLSRTHLKNPNLAKELKTIIQEHDILPKRIEFEITESAFFDHMEILVDVMSDLKAFGCKFSMDDFGSGYSSLNLLKDLAVDIIKLDKKFLDKSTDSKRGKVIISHIIHMAKDLELITICEGPETKDQIEFLKSVGCNIAQGYYYEKPMPVNVFENRILNKMDF